jgi:membrane protein implicated in regulation of membrane protease activity
VKKTPAWIWYTLIRLAAFAIPLLILLWVGLAPWAAAVVAAIIGVCVSYIFFARWRSAVSTEIYDARAHRTPSATSDEEVEDKAVDQASDI